MADFPETRWRDREDGTDHVELARRVCISLFEFTAPYPARVHSVLVACGFVSVAVLGSVMVMTCSNVSSAPLLGIEKILAAPPAPSAS